MNDIIEIKNMNGNLVVTSRQIAEDFGKRHNHVCDVIRNLTTENSEVKK